MPFCNLKVIPLFIAVLLLSEPGAFASGQDQIVLEEGGSRTPLLTVMRSDADGIEMALAVRSLDRTDVIGKGETFTLLSFEGCVWTAEIGRPRLPVIREFLEIPRDAACELVLSDTVWRELSPAELGIDHRIVPVQAPVPKREGALEKAPFVIDEAAYRVDSYLPTETARLVDEAIMRGRRLEIVELSPVRYNPSSGSIRVLLSARLKILFRGADMEKTARILRRHNTPHSDRLIHDTVLNGALFEADILGKGRGARGTGYLMIADPAFAGSSKLQDLIALRTAQGFDVTLVDTNTTGSSASNIKSYIENAYNTWTPVPEYLLLIGDTDTIPHWTGQGTDNPPTDLDYACVDGSDYVPDITRGRFPVRTSGHLDSLCDKVLAMATNVTKKAVFMAGEDGWSLNEGMHDFVIENYLDFDNWTSDKLYCHTYGATTLQVKNAFNDGRSIGCYAGHGSSTSWDDGPFFNQSNVRALTNSIYPFVISFACMTGKYTRSECFGETWVRDDRGATSFFGASSWSYWGPDGALEKNIFRGCFNHGHGRIGAMIDYGQYELYLDWGGTQGMRRCYYEMYNLMGDPAMEVIEGGGVSIPLPDIKVNGVDGPLSVPLGTPVSITLGLDPGSFEGVSCDWWISVYAPSGMYWYVPPVWKKSMINPLRTYAGPLVSFTDYPLYQGSSLPAGQFNFTFAVDELNNTYELTYSDTFNLTVN